MTALIINIADYRDKKLRGKRHRTRALGTKPLEQEPDSNGASPATKENEMILQRMRGVPAQTVSDAEARADPSNPNVLQSRDTLDL